MAELTDRQRQVLLLVAKGYTTGDIAEELGLSSSTVEEHIGQAAARLAVWGRFQAVLKALKLGEIRLEEIDV